MRTLLHRRTGTAGAWVAAVALFACGYVLGQNKAQPKTVLHVTAIKWNDGVADEEKQTVLNGVVDMATQIPGITRVWVKANRIQPSDYTSAFAIEFENQAAADAYAQNPLHKVWADHYQTLRAQSAFVELANP